MANEISFDDLVPADVSFEDLVPQRSLGQEIGRQIGLTGRAAYEGFTAPATAALEFGRGLYNVGANLLGSESRLPSVAQAQSQLLTQAGVPQPETMTERAAQAGAQAMTGTAGLAKVPGMVANIAKEVPVAGVSAFMSQPAAEVVKDYTGSDLAATLAAVGTGAISAGYTGRALNAMEKGQPVFTMKEVQNRASKQYQTLDNSGITIKPQSALDMVSGIRKDLSEARMIPNSPEAMTIEKTLKEMEKVIGTQKVPFSTLDRLRQMANDLKMSSDGKEARLGSVAVDSIDNYINGLQGKDILSGKEGIDKAVKQIKDARTDWRNASRARVLEEALNTAEIKAYTPNTSESELIRRGFINIAASPKKMALFNENEQNVIKSVAKGGSFDSLLSFMGQFNPARSKLAAFGYGTAASGAMLSGSSSTGAIAAGLAGAGWTADTIQGVLRRRAAQQAANAIASGAAGPSPTNLAYRGLFTSGLVPPDTNQ